MTGPLARLVTNDELLRILGERFDLVERQKVRLERLLGEREKEVAYLGSVIRGRDLDIEQLWGLIREKDAEIDVGKKRIAELEDGQWFRNAVRLEQRLKETNERINELSAALRSIHWSVRMANVPAVSMKVEPKDSLESALVEIEQLVRDVLRDGLNGETVQHSSLEKNQTAEGDVNE